LPSIDFQVTKERRKKGEKIYIIDRTVKHFFMTQVDTNVARIAVRLGWVPLQPLPGSLQFHELEVVKDKSKQPTSCS
jgi:endonuclease III